MSASTVQEDDDHSRASDNQGDYSSSKGKDLDLCSKDDGTASATPKSKNDDPYFTTSKLMVMAMVVILGTTAGAATFVYSSNNQEQAFEAQVDTFGHEIADSSQLRAANMFAMIQTLGITLTSHAKATGAEWPFVTFPNYEEVVSNYRETSSSRVIVTVPLVADNQKTQWETYAGEQQGWIKVSYQAMGLDNVTPLPIHPTIYDIQDGVATEALQGPFLPLWQTSPPPMNTGIVNYNLASKQEFSDALTMSVENHEPLLTQVTDIDVILDNEDPNDYESLLVQPIHANTDHDSAIVGTLVSSVAWGVFFTDLVREGNQGMVCVLKNTCGDSLTYKIEGELASFMGLGDFHDSKYDEYELVAELTPFLELDSDTTPGYCEYQVHIYPSSQIEVNHISSSPAAYTAIMALIFFAFLVSFLYYDHMVLKRQREAAAAAARSEALVQSLFPAEIRDRLFKGDEEKAADAKEVAKNKADLLQSVPEAQKFRLKNFLDEEDAEDNANKQSSKLDGSIRESKPIADLFPNTTVMFADISGFTAWSSVREPSQVFTLLETVYKSFDKTAKRRKVFKVETVGDCYVAVTGLPEPLKDHAAVMCKFARECLTQFNVLVRQLEVLLGPDTGDLAIRVGLHSGPVTAGVLRGDKSRFQLFGDTVNTAARIESTGTRNKIHLSHETAEFLHAAGKSNWLRKRTETVMAKGKGEMQTYWLLTDEELASGAVVNDGQKAAAPLPIVKANAARIGNETGGNMMDPESTLPPRIKRLVDWNVDVLKRLLKQVVAKRIALGKEQMDPNHPLMMKTEVNIGCDTYVLDEVTEIIRLPGYQHVKNGGDPNKLELPEAVGNQLRLYVASIAAMHRDNAFHNFEHASHVMMSVSKLLSRIVAPDEILKGDDAEDQFALSLHDHTYGITSDPLTQFSVVLAALIHDVDHAGVSNFQLIKEGAKIATVFKEKSVAEQNSIVLAWDRLMESRFTQLRSYIYGDPDELKRFRQLMVNTVLATDIFDKELQALRKNRWDMAFRDVSQSTESSHEDNVNRKATIVIEHLIQASDVAHTMQHWHIYQKWNERLFAEMTVAFKTGRMGFDPAAGWYQGELGFFDNYVIPLAKKLKECGVFGVSSDEYLNYALENRREWASKGEEAVERMVKKYSEEEETTDDAAAAGAEKKEE